MGNEYLSLKDAVADMFSPLEKYNVNFQISLIDAIEDYVIDWLAKRSLPLTPRKKWKETFKHSGADSDNVMSLLPVLVDVITCSPFFGYLAQHGHSASLADVKKESSVSPLHVVPSSSHAEIWPQTHLVAVETSFVDIDQLVRSDSVKVAEDLDSAANDSLNDSISKSRCRDSDSADDEDTGFSVDDVLESIMLGKNLSDSEGPAAGDKDQDADLSLEISVDKDQQIETVDLSDLHAKHFGIVKRKRGRPRKDAQVVVVTPEFSTPTRRRSVKRLKLEVVDDDDENSECVVKNEADEDSSPEFVLEKKPKVRSQRTSRRSKSCAKLEEETIQPTHLRKNSWAPNGTDTETSENVAPGEERANQEQSSDGNKSEPSASGLTICEICGAVVKGLKSHMMKHSEPKYKCSFCPFASRQLQSVNIHVSRIHTNYRPHLCEACGKGFVKSSLLKEHIREKHGVGHRDRPYKCSSCDYSAFTRSVIQRHEQKHLPCRVPEYRCDICGARLMTIYTLNEHKRLSHVEDRPFPCGICSFAAKSKKRLLSHLRVHGEKTFECETCHKRFTVHAQLVRHQLVHTGDKPYACPCCAYRAGIVENLRKHCQSVHKMFYPPKKRDSIRDEFSVDARLIEVVPESKIEITSEVLIE